MALSSAMVLAETEQDAINISQVNHFKTIDKFLIIFSVPDPFVVRIAKSRRAVKSAIHVYRRRFSQRTGIWHRFFSLRLLDLFEISFLSGIVITHMGQISKLAVTEYRFKSWDDNYFDFARLPG